ncbi:MAG TPA: creatininase family protein [Jatrophihabitans sp.]|jgi:creatinine amidohydrolase
MGEQQAIIHATATSPAVAALPADTVALISLGATEQHGPHLPLAMDTVLGEAFARRVAAMVNAPVLIYPTIPFGLSDHHRDFAGTVTVSEETLSGVMDACVGSVLRSGFSRVAMLSGHGGNFAFLKAYRDRLRAEHPGLRVAAFVEIGEMVDACAAAAAQVGLTSPECDAHAGLFETSVALHLLGADAVGDFGDLHGYIAAEPGWTERLFRDGVAGLSMNGIIGDPRGASAAAGEAFLNAIARRIALQFAAELGLELRT